MRVVFFGSGAFGRPALAMLAAEHDLRAIVTQPDRPAGRGRKPAPPPIAEMASRIAPRAELMQPENVNDAEIVRLLGSIPADAWVVIAYGQKLGRELLAGRFAINLHASLLPRWRGAAPIQAAVLAGDERTGVSVITLADRMDAGQILGQRERAIDPAQTAGELHDLLADDGVGLVGEVLGAHAAGKLEPVEQDPSGVTLAPKLGKADGWVDFSQDAVACRRRVHGLTPWPGVAVRIGGELVKLLRVGVVARCPLPPGVLDAGEGVVGCGAGTGLALERVQPGGGRPLDWADYARGRTPPADAIVTSERSPCARSGT